MPGFNTLDDIVKANSVNGRGQCWDFLKAAQTYVSGKAYSLWNAGGSPGAGSFPGTDKIATQQSAATAGAMFFSNPSGGRGNFLTALQGFLSGAVEGDLHLVDRLLAYDFVDANITSDQTMTNGVALPRYADGEGNRILVEVSAALSAHAGTFEVYYTNTTAEGLTTNRVGVGVALDASATASPCRIPYSAGIYAPMQASDRGVTKIDKAKFSATTFTTVNCICVSIVHPLWSIPLTKGIDPDMLSQAVHSVEIMDNACLQLLFVPYSSTSIAITGRVRTTEN